MTADVKAKIDPLIVSAPCHEDVCVNKYLVSSLPLQNAIAVIVLFKHLYVGYVISHSCHQGVTCNKLKHMNFF
jgi:lipid-binding SYLF domain-containing protein